MSSSSGCSSGFSRSSISWPSSPSACKIKGLIGANGILPLERFLAAIGQNYGTPRYWNFPMVFWLRHDDGFLVFVAILGAALAIVLMLGFAQRLDTRAAVCSLCVDVYRGPGLPLVSMGHAAARSGLPGDLSG